MTKEPSKKTPSKAGIDTEIESEGFAVFATFRDHITGEGVQLKLHRRSANALTALLAATDQADDDAGASEVVLRGEITFLKAKAVNENQQPPAISTG